MRTHFQLLFLKAPWRHSRRQDSYSPRRDRSLSRSISRSRSRSRSRKSGDVRNLYVNGLSPRITKRELEGYFSKEGTDWMIKLWRTKQGSVQILGTMAYCAPQQLSQCLPTIAPKFTKVLTDTHPKVQSAAQMVLQQVLVDPMPEVRGIAARDLGFLIRGMGEDNFPDLVPWLLETLKSDNSNVECSGLE